MAEERPGVYRDVTPEALMEARGIVSLARHGALATVGDGGHPVASRVAVGSLEGGRRPLLFVSALAAHTPQLGADPRCSLLVGDVGKGDPLANPRVTLMCRAREVVRDGAEHEGMRAVWLAAHLKAKVYVDLADFVFMELEVASVSFVGGFGRAYLIPREDWLAG